MPTVHLDRVVGILQRYCQGLTGRDVPIHSAARLTARGIGWTSLENPTTDGLAIYLPDSLDLYRTNRANFDAFKVYTTHQAGHLEFGTFEFGFEREGTVFRNFRHIFAHRLNRGLNGASDFERFFDLFPDRTLANDVFMAAEDTRIDFRLGREYAGLRTPYRTVQRQALEERPDPAQLPLREALMEVLVRHSLGQPLTGITPPAIQVEARKAMRLLQRLRNTACQVEDTAEATIRLYSLLASVPNAPPESAPAVNRPFDSDESDESWEEDIDRLMEQFGEPRARPDSGETEDEAPEQAEPYKSPESVQYRGGLKPELVQTMNRLFEQQAEGNQSEALSLESLEQALAKSLELDEPSNGSTSAARNLWREAQQRQTSAPAAKPQARSEPVVENGQTSYYYDEWDYLAHHYKTRWCHLRERVLPEGDPGFFQDTLRQYAPLVTGVRKQFERLRAQRLRKEGRLFEGDEYELDLVVQHLVDRRSGTAPDPKVYWRKKKIERDVAVVLLLDMSASTYENIEEAGRSPGDPRLARGIRQNKRIIDLEKESLVIMVEALESIGDLYGIYGFSGHGRENVEFVVIKSLDENLTPKVRRRVANITPVRGTRMGPAIRHSTALLSKQESKTKLLLLLSDGRPQDYDYAAHHIVESDMPLDWFSERKQLLQHERHDYLRKQYALNDTRMALLEAREKNIIPFCLTVDRDGHDYLRTMCGDIGYQVLADIRLLPRRLPFLYRRLTS